LCKDDHILRIHDALMPHKRPSFGFAGLHPANQITYVIIAASGEDRGRPVEISYQDVKQKGV
jgi:hypothetical protein